MTPRTIVFSATARKDINAIVADIALNAGPRIAARWRRTFYERALSLAQHPFLGVESAAIGAGRRRLVVSPYLIIYRVVSAERINVVRIIHGARDLPTLFGDANHD